jgi:hypothetical protein
MKMTCKRRQTNTAIVRVNIGINIYIYICIEGIANRDDLKCVY